MIGFNAHNSGAHATQPPWAGQPVKLFPARNSARSVVWIVIRRVWQVLFCTGKHYKNLRTSPDRQASAFRDKNRNSPARKARAGRALEGTQTDFRSAGRLA